jgi:prolyl-tRNA synthetase
MLYTNIKVECDGMRLSNSFFYTFREDAKDEDSISGNLLSRAGFIKKSSAGVYMFMPFGYKVLNKIINIIREEMNLAGASEVMMPSLISEDVYISSGRRAGFGQSMFSLKDRFNKPYVLGPTHEELFLMAAKMKTKSYKDLPFNIYQFQTKFRDEPRPRFGLIRVREFIMKDAYSFDTNLEGLDVSYKKMFDAYKNSFDRMQLNYAIVKADTGVMGGLLSEEFQAVTDIGEDILVMCEKCDFASNIEIAPVVGKKLKPEAKLNKELINTPNAKTIEEVSKLLGKSNDNFVKTLIYKVDNQLVGVMVVGNDEVNETKLAKLFKANHVELASFEMVEKATGSKVGFAGPIGLNIPVVMDQQISDMSNFVVGANKTDYHYKNVNVTDFSPHHIADVTKIKDGGLCPACGGKIIFKKGIEIGNTFKLGTKYSISLGLEYLDATGKLQPVVMGSYGIGPGRCMAALVEQNHDDKGILWPMAVAPFTVAIALINNKVEEQVKVSEKIYAELLQNNIDVLFDDRNERAGVKFNDLDLIGIPVRITVGNGVANGQVEFKLRVESEAKNISVDEIVALVLKTVKEQR